LLGYADYQNQFVSSKTSKLFNPFTSIGAYGKAVKAAQDAGEMKSLDQIIRLLEDRGEFARREGQEHHDSAADYAVFVETLQCGLSDLDRLIRQSNDPRRTAMSWAAVLRGIDRIMDYQWSTGRRWSAKDGQVNPVLMSAIISAGYSAFYAQVSLHTLKDMLLHFDGLVDSEGYRADRNVLRLIREGGKPIKRHKKSHGNGNGGGHGGSGGDKGGKGDKA
jgi:hypothetical protein